MTTTHHLALTLVDQAQAQKEVTVNTALSRLDAVLNTGAVDKDLATPPGSPAAGDVYIVAAGPTGAWAGQAGSIAYYDQLWRFIAPREGMRLWVNDEDLCYTYNGSAWVNALAALAGNGLIARTASNTIAARSIAVGTGLGVTNADGVSGNPTLALAGGKQTAYVPAAAMRPSAVAGCAALTLAATGSNHPDLSTLDFDAASAEYAQFSLRMPKCWNQGTLTAAFEWSHATTATNFAVVWGIQAVAVSDGDSIDSAFGTAQTVTDTGGATSVLYKSAETSAVTIAGSPASMDTVYVRIYRDAADGADTLAIDARLHGVALFFTSNAGTDD